MARFGEARHCGNAFQVVCCEHGRVGNGFVQPLKGPVGAVVAAARLLKGFGARNSALHRLNGFDREVAGGCFRRAHHGVSAVEHGVTHVQDLRARRQRRLDHRFKGLSRIDDRGIQHLSAFDHILLRADEAGITDFNAQITACHHYGVGRFNDAIQNFIRGNGLGALNFRNQTDRFADVALQFVGIGVQQLARIFHVSAGAREGHGDIVDAQLNSCLHVGFIFFRQRRCGQTATLLVDAFVVGQLAAHKHFTVHFRRCNTGHFEHQTTVVEQQHVAFKQIFGEVFVVAADLVLIAVVAAQRHVDDKRLAYFEVDRFIFETCDTDLRTLQVPEDRNVTAIFGSGGAYGFNALTMFFRITVRKVDTDNVDTGFDHSVQNARFVGGRTKRRQNLSTTNRLFLCLRHQVFLLCAEWRVVILHVLASSEGDDTRH